MQPLTVRFAILLAAIGVATTAASAQMFAPANFGTPPSGEVPIIFNDRHVYAKPDTLKANRVLAALMRGPKILIPLRSMFEQMGAMVSYDPATKTAHVSKRGSDVTVTVGKPEVVINGESRPLDVPPEISKGAVVVPVRVLAEAIGAYVQWVPDRRIVVIRYVAAAPPPPPATPTPAPPVVTPTPKVVTPSPTPTPVARNPYEHFIVGDYVFSPRVYNEFSPGNYGVGSYAVRGAAEFPAFGLPWMLEGDYRWYSYPHNSGISLPVLLGPNPCPNPSGTGPFIAAGNQGCVTVIGSYGQTPVTSFQAHDSDFDARLGLKVLEPRIYVGVGYLHREENSGYPKQNGVGFGAEKLPDVDHPLSAYGSVWYYPSISGNFTFPSGAPPSLLGTTARFEQRFLKYQIGGTLKLGESGLFLDGGFLGDSIRGKNLSPSDASHAAGYVGLGIKF